MIKRLFGSVLVLLLLLLAGSVHGEISSVNASGIPNRPLSVDPTGKTEGFSAILYNNPNGLPTSEANAITETEEGFIWIGSYAGLIRYDGNTFERFDSTTGIANVRCLLVDSRNRLWIGTNDSGVYLMTKGQLQSWNYSGSIRNPVDQRRCGRFHAAGSQGRIPCRGRSRRRDNGEHRQYP